ncbi:MAG: hypothetical protein K9N49_08405, partial [Candidatus Marinimicrobia bacterium]|nr:hypothetical protein [Candidatus Neomarinimicrobiota bacterium]
MATENQKDVPPAQPPKIRLKGVPTGTARPVGAQPPPPDKKAETTRIAVEAAQPKAPDVPAAKAQTSKVVVELGREVERPDAKSQTARIDLSAAMPGSLGRQGAETARIDLAAARPAESDSGLRPAPAGIGDQAAKSATAYIDVPLTEVSPEAAEQAKAATMRVQVDEADLASVMGETQPIGATEATGNMVQDAAKKRTVKVDLASVLSEEAPDSTAPVVLPKPGGGAPTAAQTRDSNLPRTIRLKRPGAAAPAGGGTEPTIPMEPDEGVEHSKIETARIALPPDAAHPPTRQKTIRIKRPGGAAPGRQLTIAR